MARSPSQPEVVLGLTCLIIGLTYALPLRLIDQATGSAVSNQLATEPANVYACVAWAGWAHFLYAFRGQGNALSRLKDGFGTGRIAAFVLALGLIVAVLLGARWAIGSQVFGALVWVYFIDHFLKTERFFEGKQRERDLSVARWLSSYQVLLSFGWLSAVLFNVWNLNAHHWTLWIVSAALGTFILALGGWRKLAAGEALTPLLALFFVAESLVWGVYSHYGGLMFLTGVYIFHVAAGSYFHYFGSYFFANARSGGSDKLLNPLAILGVNLAVIGLGYLVAHQASLHWLNPILGIEWFTLWVGVHLVASDVFPLIKSWKFVSGISTSPGQH